MSNSESGNLKRDWTGAIIQGMAPKAIITATAGVGLDVTDYIAVGSPDTYEYFINTDSGNKLTRTGVIVIGEGVTLLTFTANTTLEVM